METSEKQIQREQVEKIHQKYQEMIKKNINAELLSVEQKRYLYMAFNEIQSYMFMSECVENMKLTEFPKVHIRHRNENTTSKTLFQINNENLHKEHFILYINFKNITKYSSWKSCKEKFMQILDVIRMNLCNHEHLFIINCEEEREFEVILNVSLTEEFISKLYTNIIKNKEE